MRRRQCVAPRWRRCRSRAIRRCPNQATGQGRQLIKRITGFHLGFLLRATSPLVVHSRRARPARLRERRSAAQAGPPRLMAPFPRMLGQSKRGLFAESMPRQQHRGRSPHVAIRCRTSKSTPRCPPLLTPVLPSPWLPQRDSPGPTRSRDRHRAPDKRSGLGPRSSRVLTAHRGRSARRAGKDDFEWLQMRPDCRVRPAEKHERGGGVWRGGGRLARACAHGQAGQRGGGLDCLHAGAYTHSPTPCGTRVARA